MCTAHPQSAAEICRCTGLMLGLSWPWFGVGAWRMSRCPSLLVPPALLRDGRVRVCPDLSEPLWVLAGKCHLSLVLPGLCRAISSLWCSLQWFTVSYGESLLYSRDTGCKEKCHRLWHRFQPTQSWQDLSIREDKFFFFMAVLIKTRIPSAPFASPTHSILLPFIL